MDWKAVDERLVRRGELQLSLGFLGGYVNGFRVMNKKVGRRYALLWIFCWLCVTSSLCLTDSLRASPDP